MPNYYGTEARQAYKRGQFPLTKRIEGELYTVYAGSNYDTKEAAEQTASWMRANGYKVRIYKAGGKYWLAWRK